MNCKNCKTFLSENDDYCNSCGAKVINYRLTLKHFISEFYFAVLSIDSNKPIKTFVDLFKKPEVVIAGYINGTRKRYLHPFGYLTIAITLSSIFYFIFLKLDPNALEISYVNSSNTEAQNDLARSLQRTLFDYQSLIFFITIPILAFISWVVFRNKRKYNYAEHLIINVYGYSQASLILLFLSLITVWNGTLYSILSIAILFIQIFYFAYILKRIFTLTIKQLIIKTLYFIVLFVPIYIVISMVVITILLASGSFDTLIEAEKARIEVTQVLHSLIESIT